MTEHPVILNGKFSAGGSIIKLPDTPVIVRPINWKLQWRTVGERLPKSDVVAECVPICDLVPESNDFIIYGDRPYGVEISQVVYLTVGKWRITAEILVGDNTETHESQIAGLHCRGHGRWIPVLKFAQSDGVCLLSVDYTSTEITSARISIGVASGAHSFTNFRIRCVDIEPFSP